MIIFICIPGALEQVWACISWLHWYCNYLEMIKAQSQIAQHFLGFDIIKNWKMSYQETPKRQNDVIKDNTDLWVFPKSNIFSKFHRP